MIFYLFRKRRRLLTVIDLRRAARKPWRPLMIIDATIPITQNTLSTRSAVLESSNNVVEVAHSNDLKLQSAENIGELSPSLLTYGSHQLHKNVHHQPVKNPIPDLYSTTTCTSTSLIRRKISTEPNVEELRNIEDDIERTNTTSGCESPVLILD